MRIVYLMALLLCLQTALSCKKTILCRSAFIGLSFNGYSQQETDTFVVRKFAAGSNFQSLIDSSLFRSGWWGRYTYSNDTLLFYFSYDRHNIVEGFDWQVHVPATGQTVLLTAIEAERNTEERNTGIFSMDPDRDGQFCVNRILVLKQDNQVVRPTADSLGRYVLNINH